MIPAEQHTLVWESFEQAELLENGQGVHENYLALAEALGQEIIA